MNTTVLLVNFGGPRTLDDVPAFLRNLRGGEVAPAVEQSTVARYRAIGGASPLPAITEEQARLLKKLVAGDLTIRVAFRYSHPLLEEQIEECHSSGTDRLVLFVMSPFCNEETTGNYIRTTEASLNRFSCKPQVVFIHSWYQEPLFIKSWADMIQAGKVEDAFYLFSAHSLPRSDQNISYRIQVEETVSLVSSQSGIAEDRYALGWQSVPHHIKNPWIGPSVEEIMDNLEPEACQRLRQSPRFIQLMADAAPTTITRIVNEVPTGEPPFTDNDFSAPTIERHKQAGYLTAKRALG